VNGKGEGSVRVRLTKGEGCFELNVDDEGRALISSKRAGARQDWVW